MLKTPVSILQELTQMKKLPLPTYDFKQDCVSYTCTVSIGSEKTKEGQGTSKKTAKQEAAKNMLKEFDVTLDENNNVDENVTTLIHEKNTAPFMNFIGRLNEFCTKHGFSTPVYHDRSTSKFVVDCLLNDLKATGCGYNRKSAKQEAAKQMLEILKDSNILGSMKMKPIINLTNQIKEELNQDELDIVIRTVENICMDNDNNNNEVVSKSNTVPLPAVPDPKPRTPIIEDLTITKWNELETYLDNNNYKYKLEIFQETPLMLCLKINNSILMSHGNDRDEAEEKLVAQVTNMLKFGFTFTFEKL